MSGTGRGMVVSQQQEGAGMLEFHLLFRILSGDAGEDCVALQQPGGFCQLRFLRWAAWSGSKAGK